jgi:hypothetical protein
VSNSEAARSKRAPRWQLPTAYQLPDPHLRAYDHGVGTLRVDGELRGYLASQLLEMRFPSRRPWLWFVVVWLDGTKELAFEDYGALWPVVQELDAGFLDHYGPSVRRNGRFLWRRAEIVTPGDPCRFEFSWLPADQAAQKWLELGLVDADF